MAEREEIIVSQLEKSGLRVNLDELEEKISRSIIAVWEIQAGFVSRELSLVLTKLEEARMWVRDLKQKIT